MPKRRKKVVIFLVILAILFVVLAPIYYIRDDSGGYLIWGHDQAYVFMTVVHRGYRMNCLRLIAEVVMEMFPFGASAPDHTSSSAIVFRITPGRLQRFDFDNMNLNPPDAIGQTIYAGYSESYGRPLKWSGDHFEPVSLEERNVLFAARASGRIPPGPSYENVDGWSRCAAAGKVDTFKGEEDARAVIQVNGKPATLVMNSGFITHEAFIDIIRSGEAQQRIWYLDERTHRVARSEYLRTFGLR